MTQVFYAACRVKLKFRFEDPRDEEPPPDVDVSEGTPSAFGSDYHELQHQIIPFDASWTLNSYREADIATVTIPFYALPINPMEIRAATIQIFAGSVDPDFYAQCMGPTGSRVIATVPDVDPVTGISNEVFRGFIDDWELDLDNEQFIKIKARDTTQFLIDAKMPVHGISGIPADTPLDKVIALILLGDKEATFTPQSDEDSSHLQGALGSRQDARGTVSRLKARTSALKRRIQKASSADVINVDEVESLQAKLASAESSLSKAQTTLGRVDRPVKAMRYGVPGARGFRILNETGEDPLPNLSSLKGASWKDSKGSTKKGRSAGSKEEISVWDFITDLCVGSGFICYVRTPTKAVKGMLPASEIVISKPRNYYQSIAIGGGEKILLDTNEIHEFVYGRNCTLNLKRSLTGKNTPKAIEMKAIVAETGEHISARFPKKVKTNKAALGKGKGDREEVVTLLYGEIPGGEAQKTLERVAESVYEQLGRKENTITIKTTHLSFLPSNAGKSVADVFRLRGGDSVRVSVAPGSVENFTITTAGIIVNSGLEQKIERLMAIGFSRTAATSAARAVAKQQVQDIFRVKTVGVNWRHDGGHEIEIEVINYLDARNAIEKVAAEG